MLVPTVKASLSNQAREWYLTFSKELGDLRSNARARSGDRHDHGMIHTKNGEAGICGVNGMPLRGKPKTNQTG